MFWLFYVILKVYFCFLVLKVNCDDKISQNGSGRGSNTNDDSTSTLTIGFTVAHGNLETLNETPENVLMVNFGQNTSINCTASGSSGLSINWMKTQESNLTNVKGNFVNYNNTTAIYNLQFTNISASNGGDYLCEASNENVNAEKTLTIQVRPTVIISEARDTTIRDEIVNATAGGAVRINCAVDGYPKPPIGVWTRQSENSINESFISSNIRGNISRLRIESIQPSDRGVYTCTATNEAGEYQESVIINVGPRITLSGNGSTLIRNGIINATAGNTVTVNCAVDGYPEPLPGNWTRQNGVSINTNFLSNLSQDFSRLSIANIQASDGGVYICSSSSVVGENDMQVTVQVIPTTVTNTSQINFDGRENVKIFCSSSGFPRPNVTLTKITSGTTIEPSNSTSTNYLQSNNYEINNIEGDVGGEYICKGENQAGQTNTTITLQVRPTITLSKSPNNLIRAGVINAIPGNTVTVVCASNGYPKPPPGIWTRQNGDSINEDFLSNTSQGFSRLTINNIQPSDGDVYTCTARTEIGDSKKNVTINVRATITLTGDQSTIIRNGIINAIPGNTVTVVCASNGYPEPPPGIWTRQNGGSINEDLLSTTSEGFSRLTINNIQPNDGGVYICTTTNIVGDHQESVTINVRPAITISVRGRTMFRNGIVRATVNDTFVIVCDADGFPTPSKNWTRIIDSRIENVRFTMVQGSIRRRINNIQARDGGVYVCTAMNDAGSVQDQVTIQILPTISTGSDSYIFRYNRRGEISCSSAGFPTPSVTWIRNDVELQTLSSQNIYTIDMVRGDDGGEYICKAENGAGQINTSIIVEVSPKASVPETIQATLNREVTVNCNVDGFPTPNITWLKDGSQLSPTDQILITPSGVTSSTLRISNVQPSNLGEYVCEASNSVGNNSDEVTIRAFPIVTLTETIINTNRSQQVSVGCSASGFPSPSISWSRANGNLPGRANITKGLHSATLVISSIRLRDGGVYICTAENAAGTREANVTIRVSPSVSLSPESDYVNSPTQRSVNCTANGFPTPSITWKRNNGNSVLPSRLTPVEMGREVEVSLNIFDFEAVDGGDYVCTARNAAGQDTQTVTIRVEPSIMDEPTLHNFTPGNDETLVCTATGFPTPNISWRKLKNSFSNRVDITYSNQSLTSTGTLMINQIRASDGGSYVCEAENAVRKIDRTIQVQVSPAIVVSMTALILDEGDNMTVVCTANGFPRPTIVWSKVDQRNLSSRVTIRPVQMVNETAVSRRIRFRNVTYDNRGEYRCSASNFMTVSEIVLVNVTVNSTINLSAETIIVDRNRPEDDFNVRCTATGAPPIEIRWERNGEIVYTNRIERNSKDTSMNSNRVTQTIIGNNSSKEVQSILSVSSALYEDIGEYICRTRYNSTSISVNVTGPPVLLPTTQFIEEVSVDQSSVTFNCTFDGYPTPTISWYFYNGTELPQTSQFQINTPTMIKPYRISRTLTVYGLGCRGLFLYNYTCSATNGEESQPVPSGNFTVRINTTTLLVGTELMNCSQSEKFCLEHGQRLASITSINTLDDIFNEYHGADGRTVDRRNRTFFWISRMSGIHLQGIFNVSIQNCTLVRYGPAVAQQYLPQMQVDLPAYPICEKYRIQPNISKIPSTQEQCNGTYLQINWDYLPGSENLYHQIFLNETLSRISPPNTNTVIITYLQPRTPYNIQVKPSFVGCENELPYFPNIFITGRGPLNPPNILDVNYNDETESCEISWEPGQGSKGRDLDIGQYRVNISGLQRFGNANEIEMERPTFVNISTMEDFSYNFSTRPNTIYNVSVGIVPSSPCVGIISLVWSYPITGSCITDVKVPNQIILDSALPESVNNEIIITLEPVSQRNGPVSCVFLIVQKLINGEIPPKIEDLSQLNAKEPEKGYIAFAHPRFSFKFSLSLGDSRSSCCDVTMMGAAANCTGTNIMNEKNKREALIQIEGVNQPLDPQAMYSYYLIVSTLTGKGPIYSSSIQSPPFLANIISTTPVPESKESIVNVVVPVILVLSIVIAIIIIYVYCRRKRNSNTKNIKVTEPEDKNEMKNLQKKNKSPYENFEAITQTKHNNYENILVEPDIKLSSSNYENVEVRNQENVTKQISTHSTSNATENNYTSRSFHNIPSEKNLANQKFQSTYECIIEGKGNYITMAPGNFDVSKYTNPSMTGKHFKESASSFGEQENLYEELTTIVSSTSKFSIHDVPGKEILQTYKNKTKNSNEKFKKDFDITLAAILRVTPLDTSDGKLKENKMKNRFENVLPSNNARVILNQVKNQPHSDYINASFIEGYEKTKKFIAAQSPMQNTVNEFWRMIIENGCTIIIMLTKIIEDNKVKCQKYWPDSGEQMQFGDILVQKVKQKIFGEFQVTHLNVVNATDGSLIEIVHFQYLNWLDEGIPPTTSGIFRLHKVACEAHSAETGPILVHCSGGAERSGIFIAMDILKNQLKRENKINVFEVVHNLRMKRTDMVQTLEQYVFIFKLLAEFQSLEATGVDCAELETYEKALLRCKDSERNCGMKLQYSRLDLVPSSYRSTNTASKPTNMPMNIDPENLPYDHNLACIAMLPNESEIPYLNASIIKAYQDNAHFIIAMDPLIKNIPMFWRCIVDNNIKCIIKIEDRGYSENYWGDVNKTQIFGEMSVRTESETNFSDYTERQIQVYGKSEKDKHNVVQFVVSDWRKTSSPKMSTILKLVSIFERYCSASLEETKEKSNLIALIHCRDGSTQSGTLCAISNLIEQAKAENMIDVFRAVKDVRDLRMGAVGTIEQYELCYRAVSSYIKSQNSASEVRQ